MAYHMMSPTSPCTLQSACPLTSNKRQKLYTVRRLGQHHSFSGAAVFSASPADHYLHQNSNEIYELTIPYSSRPSSPRPPTLLPPTLSTKIYPTTAIFTQYNTTTTTPHQDVPEGFVNVLSASQLNSLPVTCHHVLSTPSESPYQTFSDSPSNHALANKSPLHPPGHHPVYNSHNELSTAFRLPTVLPRPPQVVSRRRSSSSSPLAQPFDFKTLSANYLNMLANKPQAEVADANKAVVPAETIAEMLRGDSYPIMWSSTIESNSSAASSSAVSAPTSTPFTSPVFSSPDDFLTSPFDDTPYNEFLNTPLFGDDSDLMTSPLISDCYAGDESLFGDAPLFSDVPADFEVAAAKPPAPAFLTSMSPSMYVLPSPSLSTSQTPSPAPAPEKPLFDSSVLSDVTAPSRRRSSANGTRKNITPDALLSMDAPIQKRSYVSESATSRKEVPALFKKRARSQAFGDDDEMEELRPNATQKEQIEWKRKQNTLAARKSRKRKLEYQQELENKIAALTSERDTWRARAMTMQSMLQQNGVEAPVFTD